MQDINLFLVFGAGLLSFLSPCTLPLYPIFLSYITGISVNKLQEENMMLQKRAFLHTVFFLIGFSIIYIGVVGLATQFLGNALNTMIMNNQDLIRQIGAILILFFGFVIVGWIQPSFLMKNKQMEFKSRPSGYVGSILIGMGFAAGWTPCMGPILASVVALGATAPNKAVLYMLFYVLGFAIPFFVLSFFVGKLNWIKKYSEKIMKIGGFLMILTGVMLYFNWMAKFTSFLSSLFGGFTGF